MADQASQASDHVALDPEVFDDEQTIQASGRLAELLRLWNKLVRAELGTVQSFVTYDRAAQVQQIWHQGMVIFAAITGTAAVLLAILQMARPDLFKAIFEFFEYGELVAAVAALFAVVLGLSIRFHTRWQLLRMKAEQYRFIKFHMVLHAAAWLARPPAQREEELRTLLAGLHALDQHDAHEWSLGVFSLVDDDPAVIASADGPLADDIVGYMRARRVASQRQYFTGQARRRRQTEHRTKIIAPACFFLSIFCAVVHFGGEFFVHHEEKVAESGGTAEASASEPDKTPLIRFLTACMIGAAAFPVFGAMFRTIRTAFEFGRNANRFDGVARILGNVQQQLDPASAAAQPAEKITAQPAEKKTPAGKTAPSDKMPPRAVQLELVREAEFVLQHENRSWMRLMIEAEWFG